MANYSVAANYAAAMLAHLEDVANGNAPSKKITPVGYLRCLAENNTGARIMSQGYESNGHIHDVRIAYQQRGVERNVSSTDDCDVDVVPLYKEVTTSINYFSKMSIYIDDATIMRYIDAASGLGTPAGAAPSPGGMLMQEHLDSIIRQANAIFQKIDRNLLTKQNSNWGGNAAHSNSNASVTVNFPLNTTSQPLASGINQILDEYAQNEGEGTPLIVGSGLFHAYVMQQKAKGLDNGGIDTSKFQTDYEFYYDLLANSVWGSNKIGVISPGSVILLDRNKYGGNFAGDKLISFNFTMPLPVVESVSGASLDFFKLDAKIMRIACPTTVDVGPYGDPTTVNEGWQLILSKYYDQFNIPNDAYDAGDRLTTNNGTLEFTVTNS